MNTSFDPLLYLHTIPPSAAAGSCGDGGEAVYDAVRSLFAAVSRDVGRNGNPLEAFITPGQTVLVKPNLVLHCNNAPGEEYYAIVTHPQIIKCVVDQVYAALQGKGRIIVGDAPVNSADFDAICRNLGLYDLREQYRKKGFAVELVDFRYSLIEKDESGVVKRQDVARDLGDYREIRMDEKSVFHSAADTRFDRLRVTEYKHEMLQYHNPHRHRYCFHKTVLEADVVISLPKIKTHRKAGFTCAMKNFVGLNGRKDWLPHHTKGSVAEGGDEYLYPSLRKKFISRLWDIRWKTENTFLQQLLLLAEKTVKWTRRVVPFRDNYWEGSWYGNKTISRTINDLNRAILYCDKNRELRDTPQRTLLYLVDGIMCGEGEGPMEATAKNCGMLIWGQNAFAVDMLVVTLMGFDHRKIDTLAVCRELATHRIFTEPVDRIAVRVTGDTGACSLDTVAKRIRFDFVPSQGWKGHIEEK